jgi:hypothetical protein
MLRSLTLAVLLSCILGCGAEADVAQLCNDLSDQQLFGTGTSTSESRTFTADFSSVANDLSGSHLTTQLFLTGVTLQAGAGIQNFDFIDSADVVATGTDGQPVTLMHYARGGATSASLQLTSSAAPDLLTIVPGGKMDVRIDFVGQMPAGSWSLSAQACVHAHAKATL